jgi:DNA repair exonuclease SbcCD ATPase subunit
MKLYQLRNILEQRKGQQIQLKKDIETLRKEIREKRISFHKHEQALEIIKEVGLKTQQQLQFQIGNITTLALEAVFDNPYELKVEFVERRNKTECDLFFVRKDGKTLDPLEGSGGGVIDIASFALRIASWYMQIPRTRNIIILDEPMRFVSEDLQEKASEMIKKLSEKLKIQFIIITHEERLTEYADKIFKTKIRKGVTRILTDQSHKLKT